jgi:CRP-like cAMP-binding protein
LNKLPKLREIISTYQQAFMFQVSQCVACNGLHSIAERCSRWLLMTQDRVEGDDLALTHEFLSYMLGVRRSSVTEVLQSIQQQGLIRYGKGIITVLNREGLEELACECYRCVRDEYDRLLSS